MNWTKFRDQLFDIFDLEPNSSVLSHSVNRFMYIVIFISTAGVILESIESLGALRPTIEIIEDLALFIFSIELIFRLLVIDLLFRNYKQFWERLLIVFYYLIDFAAILPPIILLFEMHAHFDYFLTLRLIRVFKAFRHDHSIEFILRAIVKKKNELFKSAVLTVVFTVFFAVMLFEAENDFQTLHKSTEQNFKDIPTTIFWALNHFFEEVSGFGNFTPRTTFGQILGMVIGFMKVAIVIIPTGIIATGFIEVVEEDKLKSKFEQLKAVFRHRFNSILGKNLLLRYFTILEIKNALYISEDQIYKTIADKNGLRIRTIQQGAEFAVQTNIIEFYEFGKLTRYGYFLEQPKAPYLIISPDSLMHPNLGYLAYCLAVCLDSNAISVERYAQNALNPEQEFDFHHTEHFDFQVLRGRQESKRRKKLSEAQMAFEDFWTDTKKQAQKKQTFLLQAIPLEEDFRIEQVNSKNCLFSRLGKELYAADEHLRLIQINVALLYKAFDYQLVRKITAEIGV